MNKGGQQTVQVDLPAEWALTGSLTDSLGGALRAEARVPVDLAIGSVSGGRSLTLRGLTLTGGNGEGPLGNNGSGGAITNDGGTLTLTQCTLFGNSASSTGGAIFNTGPATLTLTGTRTASLDLIEGRYHQVRRMFASQGFRVESLHRSRFGALDLGNLPPGQWCAVSESSI
jgi:hypothetical protein